MNLGQRELRHIALESCASTNSYCLELAKDGDPGNLWVTAQTQTAGKGSRGRNWESLTGNLHASLLLKEPCKKQHLGELTFVAAVAARDAISTLMDSTAGNATIQLKWPNDIILNDRKAGGILLESALARTSSAVVIGFGINCMNHPQNASYPATDLVAEGFKTDAGMVFGELTRSMNRLLETWARGAGFSLIRENWLQHAAGIGKEIKVQIPGKKEVSGIFAGIDEAGHLMLKSPAGKMQSVSTADVFLPEIEVRQGR